MLPNSITTALDKLFRDFWWGFPKEKTRNLTLKSWNSLCIPRDVGGLGFCLMKTMNIALPANLGWKILCNHDRLWVQQLQAKYIRYDTILSLFPLIPLLVLVWYS
jgi:hypothetical protein